MTFFYRRHPGFNAISDPHVDFYLKKEDITGSIEEYVRKMEKSTEIMEDLLLIGGDIANSNDITLMFLKELSTYWEKILIIPGNHEWYGQEFGDNRYNNLIRAIKSDDKLYNIIFFLGDEIPTFTYDKIVFGGATLMYNLDMEEAYKDFNFFMNDRKFMDVDFVKERFQKDLKYYNEVIDQVDVFISHVPVVYVKSPIAFKYSPCFHNTDVELRENVLYLQGHSHNFGIAMGEDEKIACINTAIGYPFENENLEKPFVTTIKIIN